MTIIRSRPAMLAIAAFLLIAVGGTLAFVAGPGKSFMVRQTLIGTWVATADQSPPFADGRNVSNVMIFNRDGSVIIEDRMEFTQTILQYELINPDVLRLIDADGSSLSVPISISGDQFMITIRNIQVMYTKL